MIPVYDEEGNCIGRVKDNARIGKVGVGKELGYTKLKDGRYVLIHITYWEGESSYAEVISGNELVSICLAHNVYDEMIQRYSELKNVELAEEVEDDN